ncbi:MAG: glycoside hydrolase family 3 C-terminal domain-containing protein [SAR324 cluster bacterium]|nr:glycoside hydrolase family 3 C-terminal domain-containing protein [SAR324 cluster bacterium]
MKIHRQKAKALIAKLTLQEKALLCVGKDLWTTQPIDRLGIPSIWMADGPHGLRKASFSTAGGLGNSEPATCFPTSSALASTWNLELIHQIGEAMGKEAQVQGIQIILGPGVNMKRDPRGGRNFEYYSEDPVLSGKMAAAFINGIQSQGVGTSLKHFAVNNQEFARMYFSSELDERTLREIYLPAFEIAVREAKPWTVMCSYNKINGTFAAENPLILHKVLKEEWGFEGFVVSDWYAVNDRPEGVNAGLHLEMPGSGDVSVDKIFSAVQTGKLAETRLNTIVEDLLAVILKAHEACKPDVTYSLETHHKLARQASAESIVLLKNENNLLPLPSKIKIAVIGEFAKAPRIQGGGSSQVVATQIDCLWDALLQDYPELTYTKGYEKDGTTSEKMLEEAAKLANSADIAVVLAGLPKRYESECFDRDHIDLPEGQNRLIETVVTAQKKTVVVLTNGSAVTMPWHKNIPCIVESWLGGQAGGSAVADILTGRVNPSGKLSETFPHRLLDCPAYLNWPGEQGKVHYAEGLYIGYRYYDTKEIEPMFPFGHGLSYTTFEYSEMHTNRIDFSKTDVLEVRLKIHNTGAVSGSEVVQLYVHPEQSRLKRPYKELKGFCKVALEPDEVKEVVFTLNHRDFSYYDPESACWVADDGAYSLQIGASSRDIPLQKQVRLIDTDPVPFVFSRFTPLKEWMIRPKALSLVEPLIEKKSTEIALHQDEDAKAMMKALFMDLPIVKLVQFSRGQFTEEQLDEMIHKANLRK